MAMQEFRLPDIGEGIAEGEIVSWRVEVGQQVKEEDDFVEVMTDKATVVITVPFDGVIKELRFKAGDVVPVESVIAVIETAAAGAAAPEKSAKPAAASEKSAKLAAAPEKGAKPAAVPAEKGTMPAAVPAEKSAKPAAAPAEKSVKTAAAPAEPTAPTPTPARAPQPVAQGVGVAFEQASPGKVLAAPATRRRAREMGVDLHQVQGTGPRGRVTNDDLRTFLQAAPADGVAVAAPPRPAKKAPAAPVAIARTGGEERVPFRGLRRKIAEAMSRSKSTAAHFTYVDDINVQKLVAMRKEAKAAFADQGVNITYLPFIMKAVVAAMKRFPMMNSALDETTNELVIKHDYHFGIATDTQNGLIVPVVRDVGHKSIAELARDIQTLAQKTRDGGISVDDLSGGTFTITNAGNIGGLFATPIINFPEVAILGVHAIKKTPIVNESGAIEVGDVMYLSVSIDHRIVDGATGAHWMNVIKEHLETPSRLLFGSL